MNNQIIQSFIVSACMSLSLLIEDLVQGLNLSDAKISDLQSAVYDLPIQGINVLILFMFVFHK